MAVQESDGGSLLPDGVFTLGVVSSGIYPVKQTLAIAWWEFIKLKIFVQGI